MEALVKARESLASSLERSRRLGEELQSAAPRLHRMRQRLPELERVARLMRSHMSKDKEALRGLADQIDRAVGPAAALLSVFDAVHGFEKPLLVENVDGAGVQGYLELVRRLEQARKVLADNCGEATHWFEDVVVFLEQYGSNAAEEADVQALRQGLQRLRDLQGEEEHAGLDGGLFDAALERLVQAFRTLLADNTVPLPPSESSVSHRPRLAPSPLPSSIINDLTAILERLTVNGKLQQCLAMYIEVRGNNAQNSLKAFQLDYLQMQFSSVPGVVKEIEKWVQHIDFVVRHLLEAEYRLCSDVFERLGADVWLGCFAEIANRAGMLDFLKFAEMLAKAKPDPIKLLKMLDLFDCLYKLRPDFNRLFAGKACVEIRNRTSELVKSVVEGSCEIFRELLRQVELQRQRPPPMDGGVPVLVTFLVSYCNELLGEPYRAILTQVLVIERSWRREAFQEKILTSGIEDIVRALEQNIETWSKAFDNEILSHLFLMNNHCYFYVHTKGTKLGYLMGDSWLKEHEQYKEYFAGVYLKESWGKLPVLSRDEGLMKFSGGRATARDLLKQRLKTFNAAFDDLYKMHANWVILDDDLRQKICYKIVQSLVPKYRSYMQSYGPLVDQEGSPKRYAKYTPEELERIVLGLFKHGQSRQLLNVFSGSAKINRTASVIVGSNGVNSKTKASLFRTSSAVV